jgi:phenylpropionate dioxygenase-like ring-hydroxylating dioxygenase large terminal subunit
LERKAVFGRAWQFAAHANAVEKSWTYLLAQIGEYEVIIARDQRGALHSMRNVCVHRGHRIIAESGTATSLQCPYHGWSYDFNGRLCAAPGYKMDSRIQLGVTGLQPTRLETYGPLIFVSLATDGPGLSEVIAPMKAVSIDWAKLKYFDTRSYYYNCNWKVAIENSVECYHCPVAHPGFAGLVDLRQYLWTIDGLCMITGGRRKDSPKKYYEAAERGEGVDAQARSYFFWPNLWFVLYPGPPNIALARWLPIGLGRTVCVRDFYFSPDFDSNERDELLKYIEQIQVEDVAVSENVQGNIETGAFERGMLYLSDDGVTERGVRQFDLLLLDALQSYCQQRTEQALLDGHD